MMNHAAVAPLSYGLRFKRYADGSVMLNQGGDLVYLEVSQFERLTQFMSGSCVFGDDLIICSHDAPEEK
jgi:hypothetical protein